MENIEIQCTMTSNSDDGKFKLNFEYFKISPGIFTILQILIGMVCIGLSWPTTGVFGAQHWFCYISIVLALISILWALLHLFVALVKKEIETFVVVEIYTSILISVSLSIAAVLILLGYGPSEQEQWKLRLSIGVLGLLNSRCYEMGYRGIIKHHQWLNQVIPPGTFHFKDFIFPKPKNDESYRKGNAVLIKVMIDLTREKSRLETQLKELEDKLDERNEQIGILIDANDYMKKMIEQSNIQQ